MPDKDQLFCSKPFEWFEVTQLNGRGGVYLCCPSWLATQVGNLRHQSVNDIWNGEKAQAIRRSILDGSFKYCNRDLCPYLQTQSGPVKRVEELEDRALMTAIERDLTILSYGPKKIICTYDQSCNLSCPSCRNTVIVETKHKQEILDIENRLRNEALKEADFLHFAGSGDPFGSPFFRKWLQTMKRVDIPNLERIHLHSNGQLWTPAIWNKIAPDIKQLIKSAEISIDAATSETYSINRRGGDFATLLENLKFISSLRHNGPLQYLKLSMVVQANNFLEMPNFVRLGQRSQADVVYFSQLVNWGTFSDEDFRSRAVHLPNHPSHSELLDLLQSKILSQSIVDLGNLTELKESNKKKMKSTFGPHTKSIWSRVHKYIYQLLTKG